MSGLLRGTKRNAIGGVDDRQRLGIFTALQIERFILDAVDMNYLPGA